MAPSRREILASLAALCATPAVAADGGSTGQDAEGLRAAERLLLVEYTPDERALMLESLEGVLDLVRARRAFQPQHAHAPALVFDPRPPGWSPTERARVPAPPTPRGRAPRDADLSFASIEQLARWMRDGQLTSERLVAHALDRLERLGPRLACVITLRDRADALAEARAADAERAAGHVRGPLHGIPWGAKDLLDTAGLRTTWGATPFRDRVPTEDAHVVRRLREAGAILVAKLSLGALAYGDLWFGGRTRNPWNLDEGSSGSSAGSAAAVVAGLVPFAVGSETLGSIVSPSMRCGATGLRPTFGRVGRSGAMPLCWSLDKLGPICRSVADTGLVLAALAGPDPADPSSRDAPFDPAPVALDGLRVGYDPAWFDGAEALDRQALDALRAAGVTLVETTLPDLPWDGLLLALYAEAAAAFEDLTLDGRDDALVWQDAEAWPNTFRQARLISAVDLVQADRLRRAAMRALHTVFAGVDALIAPSFGNPLLVATNFTGHPSLTLRTGFVRRGTRALSGDEADGKQHDVPHGITLWGRLFDEGALLTLGGALERHFGGAARHPRGF